MADISEANRKHFDERASSYDNKAWHHKLFDQLTREIQERKDWIGVSWIEDSSDSDPRERLTEGEAERTVRVLDYACGTGMISRTFAPLVSELRGVDISENMVHEYNTRASNQGLSPQEMSAICGDLLAHTPSSSLATKEYFNFDLAVVGLGFHHFTDPLLAAKRLVERLKPATGILLVIDFMPHAPVAPIHHGQHPSHGVEHVIAHHGFAEEVTKKIFEEAGCVDIDVVILGKGFTMGEGEVKHERSIFLARGRRA
ncbi:hypothetical protein GP486_001637 [Trichoglossum hirsutum]|uniref:Methyltransferase domain-containing protein n=1 Tax=Trichoglossum hirsutum TaxID=265104 RepID=A0A9P8LGH5_9PEZI|nr:hypothetical protein GP486_001637 [Trichoglossum hirsutum]